MDRKIGYVLAAIVFVAAFFRLFGLDKSPPSANWDEASYGYNAYSLWKTGKDEFGSILPLSIRSFDDFKPPFYAYMTAPIVGLWGMNEITSRFTGALCGVLGVIMLFVVTKKLTRNNWIALLAAAMMSVEPWAVNLSRLAFEANLSLVFFLGAVYLLEKARSREKYYLPAIFLAVMSSFAYNSGKVYLGLVVLWAIWQLKKKVFNVKLLLGMGAILMPVVIAAVFGSSLARFSSTSIFKLWDGPKSAYVFAGEIVNRYAAYYSPVNIFVRGTNEPNQSVHGFGVFYAFEAVFFLVGIYQVLRGRYGSQLRWWVLVSPIPAVLTWSWFSPVRIMPYWTIVAMVNAIGAVHIFNSLKPRLTKILLGGVWGGWWVLNIIWLSTTLLWYVPYAEYGRWQWGFREAAEVIKPLLSQYDRVIWESPHSQPYIFTLFYLNYPPEQYHRDLGSPDAVPIPRKIVDFGKFTYRKIFWPVDRDARKTLFVGGFFNLPESDVKRDGGVIIKDIIGPQGYVEVRIVGMD